MPDYSQNNKSDAPEMKSPKPNPIFLVFSLIALCATIATYLYEDDILYYNADRPMTWAVLLLICVVMTLFFLMCYRNPAMGQRLTGKAPDIDHIEKDKTAFHYTGFTNTDSASDEKKLNSSRKKARSSRKHYAAVTREMQSKNDKEDKPEQ